MADTLVLAIVDPYTLATDLAEACAARGVRAVAVQSGPDVPPLFADAGQLASLGTVFRHAGDLAETAAALAREGAGWVMAASESGVELTDRLSERLRVPSNGSRLSEARRNKFLMAARVGRHGQRTAAQCCSPDLDVLLTWIDQHAGYPVIVKPPESVASDHVTRCRSAAEVGEAHASIMGRPNVLGRRNTAVMVQEFLDGTEYVVDTVSWAGRHRVAAFWRYRRPVSSDTFVCYDAMEVLPGEGDVQTTLAAFTRDVLDSLEIRYGPAHTEVMLIGGAPVLVETGARLTAGRNATMGRLCGIPCQVDLAVDAFRTPRAFLDLVDLPYRLQKRAANVFLIPTRAGQLVALPRLSEIERLPSYHQMSVRPRFGEPVPRVLGVVTLVHEDGDVLGRDIEALKQIEQDGFYVTDGAVDCRAVDPPSSG